jgi:hypothetical protein
VPRNVGIIFPVIPICAFLDYMGMAGGFSNMRGTMDLVGNSDGELELE